MALLLVNGPGMDLVWVNDTDRVSRMSVLERNIESLRWTKYSRIKIIVPVCYYMLSTHQNHNGASTLSKKLLFLP